MILMALSVLFAGQSFAEKGYRLKASFEVKIGDDLMKSEGDVVFGHHEDGSYMWTPVIDSQKGYMVMAKPSDIQGKELELEFLVVNTKKTPNVVVSSPKVLANFDEESTLSMSDEERNSFFVLKSTISKTEIKTLGAR